MKISISFGGGEGTFMLSGGAVCKTVADVREFCCNRFPELKQYKNLKIFWYDEEEDEICVVTDEDYQCFTLAMENGVNRLFVEGKEASRVDASAGLPAQSAATSTDDNIRRLTHKDIVCDVCNGDVVGYRYRCLSCHDFDLCMSCEAKSAHKEHIMLRVPRPIVGPRSQESRVFMKIRQYADKMELCGEESKPSLAQGGSRDEKNSVSGKTAAVPRCPGHYRSEVTRKSKREDRRQPKPWSACGSGKYHYVPGKSEQQAQKSLYKANMAAAAMLREQAKQVKFREILSRYADPANIDGNGRPSAPANSPPLSSNGGANVAPASASSNDDVLAEARRSLKVASDAAKVASDAAWHTFRECAGLFVPILSAPAAPTNGSPMDLTSRTATATRSVHCSPIDAFGLVGSSDAGFPTAAAATTQTQEGTTGSPTTNATSPFPAEEAVIHALRERAASVNYKWLLPSEGEMQLLNERLSKFLNPLGLEFNIPTLANNEASPSSNKGQHDEASEVKPEAIKVVQSATNECEEKVKVAVPDVVSENEPQVTVPGQEIQKKSSLQTDGVDIGTALGQGKTTKKAASENEDCCSDTSSASLLTDDDEDVLEAVEMLHHLSVSPSTSPIREVAWTMVDLPDDPEKDGKQKVVGDDRYVAHFEKAFKEILERKKSEIKKRQTKEQQNVDSATGAGSAKESSTQATSTASSSSMASSTSPTPSTSKAAPGAGSPKESSPQATSSSPSSSPSKASSTSPAPAPSTSKAAPGSAAASSTQKATVRMYSTRSHVNHAIHTMMTMGFSNHDGHLTQLLEALNGDIPRALDMLMQKLS